MITEEKPSETLAAAELRSCGVCGWTGATEIFTAREMMYGRRDEFEYFQCATCRCLQQNSVPINLAEYYPADYVGFDPLSERELQDSAYRRGLREQATRAQLGEFNPFGRLLYPFRQQDFIPRWLLDARGLVKVDSRVLDIGAGSGRSLNQLARLGFTDLLGLDPFITRPISHPRFRVVKQDLAALRGTFDFIMLHHVFEHMPSPAEQFEHFRRLLRPGGCLLLRIPVASEAWERYGTDWVQLDAPRHLFLHTPKSLAVLAQGDSFELVKTVYDSDGFQFWGSEQYRRDIPLYDPRSVWNNRPHGIFTAGEMAQFEREAAALNHAARGDQAAFYFRRR